jgi:hypothetical protein
MRFANTMEWVKEVAARRVRTSLMSYAEAQAYQARVPKHLGTYATFRCALPDEQPSL